MTHKDELSELKQEVVKFAKARLDNQKDFKRKAEEIIFMDNENTATLSTHDYVGDLTDVQKQYCHIVRELCKDLESAILSHPGSEGRNFSSRCLALARTHLEQACMYAIKGVVFEGKNVKGYRG